MMKVLLLGNCHSDTLRQILTILLPGANVSRVDIAAYKPAATPLDEFDFVLVQDHTRLATVMESHRADPRVIGFPNVIFNGYHPDMVALRRSNGGTVESRVSAIAWFSQLCGLSQAECVALYRPQFVDRLNYGGVFKVAQNQLIEALDRNGMCGHHYFDKWHLHAPFMLNPGHPRLFVMVDIARHLCSAMGLRPSIADPLLLVTNRGRRGEVFPTLNHDRDTENSLVSADSVYVIGLKSLSLPQFVARCYKVLSAEASDLVVPEIRLSRFKAALQAHRKDGAAVTAHRVNPYADLPASHFWQASVAETSAPAVSPIVSGVHGTIGPHTRVATAGSCFAQHISKTLVARGLDYYVAEAAPAGMSETEAGDKRYGTFSARYGNIYTARQLLQLMKMANGSFQPIESAWRARGGGWIDPFRPNVGDLFADAAGVAAARREHLGCVRTMLQSLDVLVFTLGLTEAWVNRLDGSVYPVAPGVVSEHESYADYRFQNFTHDEVRADLVEALGMLRKVNRRARVVLTVSPVPLIATHEREHVLSATTYSKSVLRSVAQELARAFRLVDYFPSFEIITGAFNRGAYFDDDLRSVKPAGVEHVMKVFATAFVTGTAAVVQTHTADSLSAAETAGLMQEIEEAADVVCDEQLIASNR